MPIATRPGIAVLTAVLLLAGCTAVDAPGTSRTSTAATDGVPGTSATDEVTTASTTTDTETGDRSSTTPSCRVEGSEYAVTPPDRPPTLNESTVERLAVGYEKSYQRARHDAAYNLTFYQSTPRWAEVEATGDGFEVTVKLRVDFETNDGMHASGGYPHTYRMSGDEVVREGTTIACWNGGD